MKESNISFSHFCDSFSDSYKNNFSYKGKRALYDYLEEYEESTGEEIELDPVALCCEYSEHDSALDAAKQYNAFEAFHNSADNQDEQEKAAPEWLGDHTQIIDIEGAGVIIQDF